MQSTQFQEEIPAIPESSPFDLTNNDAYSLWKNSKKPFLSPCVSDLLVAVADPSNLSAQEKSAIIAHCQHYNMAIYALTNADIKQKTLVHDLGSHLQMEHLDANLRADEDSVSSLEVRPQAGTQYIPYTNKALSWHTDGYYNRLDKQIFGIIMHCVSPAQEGGVNRLLDPEVLYIALRDENPAYIEALMHPQAMTIPENVENGVEVRAAQTGPVFMLKPAAKGSTQMRLHMRFSARKRNIVWRDTPETQQAVDFINDYLRDDVNVVEVALTAGQGIVCNNVLHNRTGFTDAEEQKRLMYRARYYDAVCEK